MLFFFAHSIALFHKFEWGKQNKRTIKLNDLNRFKPRISSQENLEEPTNFVYLPKWLRSHKHRESHASSGYLRLHHKSIIFDQIKYMWEKERNSLCCIGEQSRKIEFKLICVYSECNQTNPPRSYCKLYYFIVFLRLHSHTHVIIYYGNVMNSGRHIKSKSNKMYK